MNNVRQPLDPSLPSTSKPLREVNTNAKKPFQDHSANRARRLGTNFRRHNGKTTSLTAGQFKPPTFHSRNQISSINSSDKIASTSQPTKTFAHITPTQNAVASSSTIPDNCYNDTGEAGLSQTNYFTPRSPSQDWFSEEPQQDGTEDNGVNQRPKNARVVYERNAKGNKQTKLCFRPIEIPARKVNSQLKISNQIDRRVDISNERIPMPRPTPMPFSRSTPLPQNTTWMSMPMAYRPSGMQQYNFDPSQEGIYYHGQKITSHVVDRELRTQSAAVSTPPDVKPVINRRLSVRNDVEEENEEVEHIDRRQALYPGVYDQDDGELYLIKRFIALMTE